MLWGVTAILVGLIVGVWAGEGVEGREGRSITWADMVSSEEIEYDDSYFKNDDYVYVDADEVDLPPPPETDTPHKLERRTLGYILGSLMGGDTEDPRPQRSSGTNIQPATPPPSSFLESIMRSIDNFVVQDLKGWSKFLTAMNERYTTPAPTTTTPRPVAIQPTQDEELVVIMDEFGRPQVVTVNDIVASLSQLDEQTITELLLGPSNPGLAPKSAPAPAKNPVQSDFLNAITGSLNRLPANSQARTSHSLTTVSPIESQTTVPKLSPSPRPSVSPTNRPNIIASTSHPKISSIINSTPKPINTTPRPIISTPRPINSTPRPFISPTRPPSKSPSSRNSPQGPAKRPTSFPNISSIPSPTKTPTKTPIDVPNIGAILGPTINSPRGSTQTSTNGATHSSSHGSSTHISTHSPTRTSAHGPTQGSSHGSTQISTHGPTRTPSHGPTTTPGHGPSQSFSRGSTHLSTHGPTRNPIQSSSRGSSQSFSRGPPHTIIRGTSTRGPTSRPTHSVVRGTPTRTLAQSFAQGIPSRSHTNDPTRGPTHRPSQTSKHGSTHRSSSDPTRGPTGPIHSPGQIVRESPSIIRATPILIPTGVPTRNPGRPDTLPPDFLLPSAYRNNVVKQSSSDSVTRPVRHTGPSHGAPPEPPKEGEEVILIRDETGTIHMHTIQDIISSLAALSPGDAQDLLFGEVPSPPPTNLNLIQGTQTTGSATKPTSAGSVHAAPRPRRPTSVQDVIAAAEEAEEPRLPHPVHAVSSEQLNPSVPAPATTTPRPSLVEALRQQDIPESIVQHLAAPSILRPVTQAPPEEQTTPGGIGATLRGMLSRFVVGQPQQQQQLTQQQQSHAVVGQLGLALPRPIHHNEAAPASSPNTLQATTKQSPEGATLPPALQHLSPAVQAALREQANNVPTFVPPGTQHAASRSDEGPVEYIAEKRVEAPPTSPPTPAPTSAPPLVLPPDVLKQLPPSVLNKVTKQYIEARVGGAPQPAQDRDYYQPVAHYYDYEVHPPVVHYPVHPPVHHHYGHSHDHGYGDYGALAPMLDIFLLADVAKVHKVGDTNFSIKAPKIGDPSYFVDTRSHDHDHY